MPIIDTPAYKKAFIQYLRKGTPIDVVLKAAERERSTQRYIWRTMGDNKVRASHMVNNGRLFSWNMRPSTGHPGEDYNCRCKAEPYIKGKSEFAYQTLFDVAQDHPPKWGTFDFLRHYYFGGGKVVTLQQTGHLSGIIDYYLYHITRGGLNSRDRVNLQIIEAARKQAGNSLWYDFNNSYTEFGDYFWVFGGGVVTGTFNGDVRRKDGMLLIKGDINYRYHDTFTDPVNARQYVFHGTSNPEESSILALLVTDVYGVFFDSVGNWQTQFSAEVNVDPANSIYR